MAGESKLGTFVVALSALGVGAGAVWLGRRWGTAKIPISRLVNAAQVRSVANEFKAQTENDFIMAAWRYASENIEYSGYGSTMFFINDWIRCQKCLEPLAVIAARRANCVGKSILLASLLRTRLPASRVFVVVGDLNQADIGGHAWVMVQRQGEWYILEATAPPAGWVTAQSKAGIYVPKVLFNDEEASCADANVCVKVAASLCLPCLLVST